MPKQEKQKKENSNFSLIMIVIIIMMIISLFIGFRFGASEVCKNMGGDLISGSKCMDQDYYLIGNLDENGKYTVAEISLRGS